MLELQQTLDVEPIVDRARSLWRAARDRASTARIELFVKAAMRSRVSRDLDGKSARSDRVRESGLALRAFLVGQDRAGFAASSGHSEDVVRWAVDTACTFRAQASASAPSASDSVAAERWDLEAAASLPTEDALTTALGARPHLEWIEAGTTVEVLIGAEGWLAVRRRHRLWARCGGPGARLVAQRGIAGWERLVDDSIDDSLECGAVSGDWEGLVLAPAAAAPLVSALVDAFHGSGPARAVNVGKGWHVVDEPVRSDGLAGGSFDDAGFPAASRILATDGVWVGMLKGPGSFWRVSFREPPRESATNLLIPSGEKASIPNRAAFAGRCRVLRPSAELWVLELDLVDPGNVVVLERRWVRVEPQALLASCAARLGRSRVTPTGPIVPTLMFEGSALSLTGRSSD